MTWAVRPLDEIYAAIFIDAIVVKVRDGQVANRPVYAAIGVTLAGERDILGLWAGTGGEGAKFWMSVLTDMRNRGVRDVFFLVCDGLKGLPRRGQQCVAACHRANLHHSPDPQHVPADRPSGTGMPSNATSSRSTPRLTPPRPAPRWMSWPRNGASSVTRAVDPALGKRLGASSSRSWTTTWRYGR